MLALWAVAVKIVHVTVALNVLFWLFRFTGASPSKVVGAVV